MDEDEELLLLCILEDEQVQQEPDSRNPSFQSRLNINSRRLRQGKIRRQSLLPPGESAFAQLFESGQDDALVTICGFDHVSFASLHSKFKEEFERFSPYSTSGSDGRIRHMIARRSKRRGRKRLLSSIQCLGLALAWTRTRGSYAVLQIIFGLTPGNLSLWLRFA